jgi:hypothetical protein
MLQDKQAKEEEGKEDNRPGQKRGQLAALAVVALPQALPEALTGVSLIPRIIYTKINAGEVY